VAQDLPTLIADARKAKGKAMMINLTDSAINAVRNAISTSDKPVDGLRIMVEAGGCAGLKYNMGLVNGVEAEDTVIEREGVRVLVDSTSIGYLEGTTIDFVIALEGSGFTFDNPNAKSSCGCGKSFA
jgi:iron-sulfur cluster assembly protein